MYIIIENIYYGVIVIKKQNVLNTSLISVLFYLDTDMIHQNLKAVLAQGHIPDPHVEIMEKGRNEKKGVRTQKAKPKRISKIERRREKESE